MVFGLFTLTASLEAKVFISGYIANPAGTDGIYEYIQLIATTDTDFSATPYTIIECNNGAATSAGWTAGGALTYAFSITSGSVTAGSVFYVGGSGKLINGAGTADISSARWVKTIDTVNSSGDSGGSVVAGTKNAAGVFGNGGSNADGIAVFNVAIALITSSTVPEDAVFFGTAIGTALVSTGSAGYQLPVNDLYNGGKLQSNSTFFLDPASGAFTKLSGTFDTSSNTWTRARTATAVTALTGLDSIATGISLVTPSPSISGATTTAAFTTTYGTVSTAQTFSIGGSNLSASITATAPTGFEVSSDGTTYGTTATFTQSGGSASGSLRVRLKANAAVSGSYNGQNIVLSSTGATSVNIVTAGTGNAVTAKGLTITANPQTVPAGSALANVTGSTLFTPSGLANSETVGSVSLSFGGNGASAGTFAGAIVPSAATGGTFTASNYSISYVAGTLTVSAAAVPTITSGNETLPALSSTYGTASSSTSFTVSGADMKAGITVTAPTGFEVSTDDTTFSSSVTVGSSGSIGSTTVYVRLTSSVSAGPKGGSVALSSTDATTINVPITTSTVSAKGVTGSFVAANKTYDGATGATVNSRSLTGVLGNDQVTLSGGTATFDTAFAGTGKSVTLTGATLAGTAKDNYTLSSVATTTADITKANQTITFNSLSAVNNDFSLSATANSGLPVSFTSSNLGVATVSGNQVTLVAAGNTTITATQAGNENYEAATSVTQELTVSSVPYRLVAGDIAVIGYNTSGTPDSITILILKDLSSGAVFYVNDNETTSGATAFTDLAEGEASFTVKSGQTIPSGTVITLPWGGAAVSTTQYDWSTTSGFGLSNNNEEIYIYAASSITATTPTVFVYAAAIGTSPSGVPTGLALGTTFIKPQGTAARYKISGAVYAGPAETLLPAIGNITNNWEAVAPGATTDWSFNTQYLLPVISGLSPSSVLPGGTNFNLVINGSNFYTTTQVTLAGVSKTVTYVNSGQLTIPVTAAEIASAGSLAVVVTTPTPGGGSASQSLAVNSGPSLALTPPAINSAFASTIQTATTSRTFKVAGSNLTTGITLAPPTGFEISLDDVSFSTSILLLQTDGVVAETTLYLRFNPSAVQSYSGDVTAATGGLSPSPSFAVLGNSAAPNEGKLTATFADGSATLGGTAPTSGTVTEYIVLAKVGSTITDVPSGNGSAYTASATYGSGTKIGDSYVVYKGSTPPSVYQVTGLTNRLRYYFTMYSRVATDYSTGNSTNGFPYSVLGNVITQWNFNSQPLDAPENTATGSFVPLTGLGTLEGTGSITTATFSTGLGSTDNTATDNSGAQTTNYPAQGSGSGTTGVTFRVSTVGKDRIEVYWDVRHSNTSSRYTQFQYTTDGGTTWNNYEATGDLTEGGLYVGNTGDTWFLQRKADLSAISAVNNNANFAFRIVTVFAPGTSAYAAAQTAYGTTGTLRYDMVTVTGANGASNSAPTQIGLSATVIAENNAVNAVVGTLSTTDSDVGDSFTYTLVSGTGDADNASFNISGSSLRASVVFDYETKSSYSIRVRTTDSGGGTFEKVFAITVTNVSDSPADYKVDWLAANGLEAGLSWDSDPNNVGYTLATAYAFGLSPSVSGGAPVTNVSSPTGSLKIVYLQKDSGGVTYTVMSGTDLADGLNGNVIPLPSTVQPSPRKLGYTQYEATYIPPDPATKAFMKVQAEVP